METINPKKYFFSFNSTHQKQYEALRSFYVDGLKAFEVAQKFGYSIHSFYSLIKNFKQKLKLSHEDPFFRLSKPGPKEKDTEGKIKELIIVLRKRYLSVPEIKSILDAKGYHVSERYISFILKKDGFTRLPRRSQKIQQESLANIKGKIEAPKSEMLTIESELFSSTNLGILCLLPYLVDYGIDKIIEHSIYPETAAINKLSSVLSFLALKISNIRRYSADDLWCMDRGMGLFAGLNVLPKASWFTSYSHRITHIMNISFLKELHKLWKEKGLLSDTMNLDFTVIPYWGDDDHLENNWSGKRNKSMASILAVLAQDPDSGIIDYGNTTIRHKDQADIIFEFIDFYRGDNPSDNSLKYLIFDSKFTPYHNLKILDEQNIKFITIRRRGKNIVEKLKQIPTHCWKKIRIMKADGKGRTLSVYEEEIILKGYDKPVRQIAIEGHGKIKPALIITNDFIIPAATVVRKYSRRWLIEKCISEQIEFFHFNRVSSSMVIKVDFDLVMTILAHNIYRLFAANLSGYSHQTAQTMYDKFLNNSGEVEIKENKICIKLKKKRNLPLLLTELDKYQNRKIPWLGNYQLIFLAATTS